MQTGFDRFEDSANGHGTLFAGKISPQPLLRNEPTTVLDMSFKVACGTLSALICMNTFRNRDQTEIS